MNQLDTLTLINLDDLIASFGWGIQSVGARILRWLFLAPARIFANQMVSFDRNIALCGLPQAARILQRGYVKDIRVHGMERIPPGPILVLSNHPGMTDTTSIFSALGRTDLKIVALPRPFLMAMPNMSRQLLYVNEDAGARVDLIRQVSRHLRECGAVLTFPAGHIEPDPEFGDEALTSLESWTASVGLFARMAPEAAVVPILVRGVVWDKAARNPLLLFRRTAREKEKLAAALQLLAMVGFGMRPVTVRIQIGRPIFRSSLELRNAKAIHQAVLAEMKYLIENPPEGTGESVL